MNEPLITVVGNVAGDPELRFTGNGKAVCGFTVASTPRVKDAAGNWEDGTTTWLRCSAWEQLAEHCAESLEKGTRVIVQGRMSSREWEDREGNKRTSLELQVDAVGPELRFATAKVAKSVRSGGQQRQAQQQGAQDPWAKPAPGQPAADPWGAPAGNDEPPF